MVYIENYIPVVKYQGFNTQKDVSISGATTLSGTTALTGVTTITGNALSTVGVFYPVINPATAVSAHAATANLAAADMGANITNTGASGAIVLTLLAAATAGVTAFRVQVTVAQTITLTPQTSESIYLGGSGVASKYALIAGVIGNYVDVYCDGTQYLITGYSGVVTKQA